MRLVATKSIELNGVIYTPGTEFDADDAEGKRLVRASKAERKDGLADDDEPAKQTEKP